MNTKKLQSILAYADTGVDETSDINDIVIAVFRSLISKTPYPFNQIGDVFYLPFSKIASKPARWDYFTPSAKRYFTIRHQGGSLYSIELTYNGNIINTRAIILQLELNLDLRRINIVNT